MDSASSKSGNFARLSAKARKKLSTLSNQSVPFAVRLLLFGTELDLGAFDQCFYLNIGNLSQFFIAGSLVEVVFKKKPFDSTQKRLLVAQRIQRKGVQQSPHSPVGVHLRKIELYWRQQKTNLCTPARSTDTPRYNSPTELTFVAFSGNLPAKILLLITDPRINLQSL